MSFVLSKLLWIVMSPGNVLALALAAGVTVLAFGPQRWRRRGFTLTASVAGVLLALLIFPVDAWLLRPLEERFPVPALPERVDGIIVLGGMVDTASTAAWGRPKLNHEADRLTELVALARRYPQARLVFTGGTGALVPGDEPTEAAVARDILERLGLPPERVLFEGQSRNTFENVRYSRDMVQPKPGERWVLITSAAHMPRSVGIFRRLDWPVLPDPVAFRLGRANGRPPSLDVAGTLFRLDEVVHEWVGLLAYRLMDRTDSWLPGP
jgi:uncharacterized SAM-binding protein YcdF (DUF218 family)